MARQRRASCEAVGNREPPKGGEAGASGSGAERSNAPRLAGPRGWREPPATEAERPSHGGGKVRSCRSHLQAQRAASISERRRQGSSPEGRRPRSGLRGAVRGEAAPGGIEPGDRSEGPGGRPYFPIGPPDDEEPPMTPNGRGLPAERVEESPNRAASDRLLAVSEAMTEGGKMEEVAGGGARIAAATRRPQNGEPTRGGWRELAGKEGAASVRRWRVSAEPDTRPGC